MAKEDFMPHDEASRAKLFCLFRDQIGQFLPALGIPANDPGILQQAADATRYRALVDFGASLQASAQAWTAMKNWELLGSGTTPSEFAMPVLPPNFPPAVAPGIVDRFRRLVRRIKRTPGYTAVMGTMLGIEGHEPTARDLNSVQPEIAVEVVGNSVLVKWGWGGQRGLSLLELQVDRGDGQGWVVLTFDMTPNYKDTHPFPAAPAKWKYRAIYRVDDARVGQWSNEVSVTVGG